ncbi:hypothetical protein LC55x_2579 [Lysobacter capsici]|nr:hypothetical protein LC55x_2579 [Lysobacter capsici]
MREHAGMSFLRTRDPDTGPGCSEGVCHVYVLPCAYKDLLKLGFSRNPLSRAQALQARYFEFFDLDRAFLIQTETVRDARDLELRLRHVLIEHNAPAPLTVRREAGGHSEWYRGAYTALAGQADALEPRGYTVYRPSRAWFARELAAQGDQLFERASMLLAQLQGNLDWLRRPDLGPLRRNLIDALDAHAALEIDLEPRLPQALLDWYRGDRPA